MKYLRAALICSVAVLSAPAYAGEQVLYGDMPSWVDEADLDAAMVEEGPANLLYDWQYRLEDGVEYSFIDVATRLENPQALMQQGTLSMNWLPDKGDLTVHKLEIHRDGEVVDLLADGIVFEVLRREQGLEQRLLDGQLTATLAVPGLREGDVLRVAHSISIDDQALGDEVQAAQYLPSEPWQVGQSRVIVSWPVDEEMFWRTEDRVELAEPVQRGDYNFLEVTLPLAERDPVPADSPSRYRRPEVLRVGSFESWRELSEVMTPHFEAAAQVDAGSQVAQQAAAIMARSDDTMQRMAYAVQLVQDEVSYLLDGLDGGNYLPQSADETWAARYGDCKAKSVLLLSLLREMGITSEVVLVTTQGGDAVPELLPLPAAFNHMIVHAVVDGEDYWLDGTSSATRLSNIGDVPPFFFALPLRDGGSDLMAMEQRDLAMPQVAVSLEIDHSAGTDFPLLFDLEMRVNGAPGAPLRALVDANDPAALRQMARTFGSSSGLEGGRISAIEIDYDEDDAVAIVRASGVANSLFEWVDGRMEMDVDQGDDPAGFNPDRARSAWREIPVATVGPHRQHYESQLILPDGGEGYNLTGETDLTGGFGNVRVERRARIENGVMYSVGDTYLTLGEIPADELSEVKRAARRLESNSVELATPEEVIWRWDLGEEERRTRSQPIIEAYGRAIEFADHDDYSPLQSRAMFQEDVYAFEGALADYDILVEETPSPWAYHRRANVLQALGREDEAIADLQAAYDLDPLNGTAFALARLMAYQGQEAEAKEMLEFLPVGESDELTLTDLMATVSGLQGDTQTGLMLIAEQVDDRPTNADVLNTDCWYRGLFNVALDDAVDQCTRAVERAAFAAAALDSRALVRFRLGLLEEALSDLDAALEVAPGLAPSLYLRGIVRMTAGDSTGQEDITTALRMSPQLSDFYARHGITPPG